MPKILHRKVGILAQVGDESADDHSNGSLWSTGPAVFLYFFNLRGSHDGDISSLHHGTTASLAHCTLQL
jgi:hypothetical protein